MVTAYVLTYAQAAEGASSKPTAHGSADDCGRALKEGHTLADSSLDCTSGSVLPKVPEGDDAFNEETRLSNLFLDHGFYLHREEGS